MNRRLIAGVVTVIAAVPVAQIVHPGGSPASAASLPAPAPHAVAAPDGLVWATDPAHDRLVAVSSSGKVTRTVNLPTGSQPNDIAVGADGALWFTEPGANAVGRWASDGALTSYPASTPNAQPWGIAAMPSGILFFTERGAGALGSIIPSVGIAAELPLPDPTSAPAGIVAGADGNAWFAESAAAKIGEFAAGAVKEWPVPSGSMPSDVALGDDGRVWVSEPGVDRVARISTTGAVDELALPVGAAPAQIADGPDGATWIAEPGRSRIARVVGDSVTERNTTGRRTGVVPAADGALYAFDSGSLSPVRMAGAVALPATCALGPACVAVDATQRTASVTHVGEGFLHSTSDPAPSPGMVNLLSPTSWRVSSLAAWPVVRGTVTYTLSDNWYNQTYGQSTLDPTGQVPPWSVPDQYQAYIKSEVSKVLAAGDHVDYWEVQNEPSAGCCGTVSQQLQQFKLAYDAIKSVDPSLKVMGPSLPSFADQPYPAHGYRKASNDLDLQTFLDFAIANGEHWDALSWHEINPDVSQETSPANSPEVIVDHVRRVRALLAQRPAAGNPVLAVNEYGGSAQRSPGWDVGYYSALERAGVAIAGHACWNSTDSSGSVHSQCRDGSLDGLLTHTADALSTRGQAVAFYTSMTGPTVQTVSTDPAVTGLATVSGSTVSMLVGRHEGCFPATSVCALRDVPAGRDVAVSVRVPSPTSSRYTVTVTRYAATGSAAPTTTTSQVRASGGVVRTTVPAVVDGGALAVTIAPA